MTPDVNDSAGVTRRAFLAAAGLAAAAGASAEGAPADDRTTATADIGATGQRPSAPVKAPVRLGIVGGHFGAQFYWHEHPLCKVVAVSDLIPERRDFLKQTYHCDTAYDSLDAMLASAELDAVALFTPATELVDHCIQCLEKGWHVAGASPAAMTVEGARRLRAAVHRTGRTYFMAETSYYHQPVISAREWYREGHFGRLFACEAEYHHPGLEEYFFEKDGRRTWRYGLPPMLYSTHCTGQYMGVTGERLARVTCYGWGNDSPILKDNPFGNPYWGETALFESEQGNTLRAQVYWRGALGNTERANWLGEKMSFWAAHPNGSGAIIRRTDASTQLRPDGKPAPRFEKYDQPLYWQTDLLPEPLRHITPHDGSHGFLCHEFISALVEGRTPAMPVELALDMALPGIIAHQSAMQHGKTLTIPRAADL